MRLTRFDSLICRIIRSFVWLTRSMSLFSSLLGLLQSSLKFFITMDWRGLAQMERYLEQFKFVYMQINTTMYVYVCGTQSTSLVCPSYQFLYSLSPTCPTYCWFGNTKKQWFHQDRNQKCKRKVHSEATSGNCNLYT